MNESYCWPPLIPFPFNFRSLKDVGKALADVKVEAEVNNVDVKMFGD